jgi:capsular polysaccharide transport system permease protein
MNAPARPVRRWLQRLTSRRLALGLVLGPLLLAGIYFGLLAQDRYVSTSLMTVRRANHESVAASGLAQLLAGSGSSHEDALYLRDYLQSLALMHKLDGQLHLRAHYAVAPTDPFYRLWPQASQEWMLAYWRARVQVKLDEVSGLLQVRVEGFDAAFAQKINQALLAESEAFVNTISQRIAQEQLRFAQTELDRAGDKLDAARLRLLRFQSDKQILDPTAAAQATGALTAELRGQLAKLEAELSAKRAYLNDDAADVVTLRDQAAALRLQIERESRGATRPDGGALNRLALEFHEIKARASFAEDGYKAALAAVESTRLEASRKVKSLVVIEPPTLAQTAEYPRRLYNLVTAFVLSLLLYGLAHLLLATVNEHLD